MSLTKSQENELRNLVASGQRIVAVKRCREMTGLGLNEALQLVNRLSFGQTGEEERPKRSARGQTHTPHAPLDPRRRRDAEEAALAVLREGGGVVEAVKRYRQRTGLGLKESKDEIDILTLVHHSEGRVSAQVAKVVIARLAEGRKDDAITQLMAGSGYDETEARAFIAKAGQLGVARKGCGRGCVIVIAMLLALIAMVMVTVLDQAP